MELLMMLGMLFLFGIVGLSVVAQRQAPPAPVFVLRTEPLERPEASGGGAGLVVFLLVVVIALALL